MIRVVCGDWRNDPSPKQCYRLSDDPDPCQPVRVYVSAGRPVNGCQRVPETLPPETAKHRVSYGSHVRAEAHYSVSAEARRAAANKGGKAKWKKR